ncbi:MAG: tetratricopeptide repeat protein, partial [Pseudomonadota bacterium]
MRRTARCLLQRAAFLGVIAFTGLAPTMSPAAANSQRNTVSINDLSAAQIGTLIRRLVASGRYDQARAVAKSWRSGDAETNVRIQFTEALIAAHSGNHREAARRYRAMLQRDPNNDAVRLALTQSLAALNDVDGVRAQTRFLVQSGFDDRVDGAVTRLLDRVEDARPVQFSAYASLLPSTNINGGTDNDTVEIAGLPFSIDEQARRKSGIGFELGGNVAVRQTMTPTVTFLANMKAVGRFYPSVESVQLNFDTTAGLAKRFGRNKSASLALTGSTSHSGERFTRQSIGVQGEFQNRFNARWSGYLSGF